MQLTAEWRILGGIEFIDRYARCGHETAATRAAGLDGGLFFHLGDGVHATLDDVAGLGATLG